MINSELSYIVDLKENLVKWLDSTSVLKIYGVLFDSIGIAMNYNFIMSKCLFESNRLLLCKIRQELLENAIDKNE